MAGTGPGDLDLVALDFLTVAATVLDTIPTYDGLETLKGAPERRYLSPGKPFPDCDQLTVYVPRVGEDTTRPTGLGAGTRHKQEFRANIVTFVVTLYRCVPKIGSDLKAPRTDAQEAADAQLNADAWALWNGLWNRLRSGELRPRCSLVYMDSLAALPNSGGYGGWELTLRAQVEGYEQAVEEAAGS